MYSSPFRWPTPKRLWRRFSDGPAGTLRIVGTIVIVGAIAAAIWL